MTMTRTTVASSQGADARERLIRAGVAAMRERSGRPLPAVSADEVVALSGVPKSTLYQLWGHFDDFRRDLLVELLRTSDHLEPTDVLESVVPVLERGGHPGEILLTASMAYFDQFVESETFRWLIAAYPHRDEAAVGPEIARILAQARERFTTPIGLLVAAARRRPVAGLDAAVIAQLLVALYVGLAIREQVDPGSARALMPWRGPDGAPTQWPRVAVATQALIVRCTEPV